MSLFVVLFSGWREAGGGAEETTSSSIVKVERVPWGIEAYGYRGIGVWRYREGIEG